MNWKARIRTIDGVVLNRELHVFVNGDPVAALYIKGGILKGHLSAWFPNKYGPCFTASLQDFAAKALLSDLLGPLDFAPKAMKEAA